MEAEDQGRGVLDWGKAAQFWGEEGAGEGKAGEGKAESFVEVGV